MNIRRPVAALFVALTLVGGGSAVAGCSPAGGGVERNDGDTSDNDTGNTSGNDPSDVSQGNLPDNNDNAPDDNSNSERDEGESDGGNR